MQSEPAHELLHVGEVLGTTEAFSACARTLSEREPAIATLQTRG